jgi:transposase
MTIERTPIMGLFKRSKQTARTSRKPTWRERKAAERTAQAEASLVATEQKIHQIADDARRDLKGA